MGETPLPPAHRAQCQLPDAEAPRPCGVRPALKDLMMKQAPSFSPDLLLVPPSSPLFFLHHELSASGLRGLDG